VELAVQAARESFHAISEMPAHRRCEILRGIAQGISERSDELAQTICDEAGKPIKLARGEVERAITTFSFAADEALRIGGETIPLDCVPGGVGRLGITRRFPAGPVLAISPFNFPLNLVAHKVAPAIASGNSIVLKPASQTPMSALTLAEIALDAGLPPGVLNVIPCRRDVADRMVEDPRFGILSFTGSAAVGWDLKGRAGRKKVILELGGNAAAIVEPDVDVEGVASRLAVGSFAYAGQICISVQRIFVHRSIERRFIDSLLKHTEEDIRWGDPRDPEVICGPLIDSGNVERILGWIEEARSRGAEVLCGGERHGNVVTPTVITGADPRLRIVAEEAFGPVVVVDTYSSFDEAISKVNDSAFGLQAGIFTNDLGRVFRAFERIEVGGLIHNDYPTFRVDPMPYGGVKSSGFGREGLRYAIEEMTELRLLVLRPEG